MRVRYACNACCGDDPPCIILYPQNDALDHGPNMQCILKEDFGLLPEAHWRKMQTKRIRGKVK
jgi:hypothetical protein